MTDEESFLAALQADPGNDLLRKVYADWLDDHDRPGGDFLRLECELHAKDTAEGTKLRAVPVEFKLAAKGLPHSWLAAVSRVPIEVCGNEQLQFAFQCPKRWEDLQPQVPSVTGVRHCDDCDREVYFCSNKEQALAQAALGRCIAISLPLVEFRGDFAPRRDMPMMLMGALTYPPPPSEAPKPWYDPRGWFT